MGNKKKIQRKKEEKEEKCPDLPQAIIYDILLRIPPELLYSKFRLVCRCWLDIISSPRFAEQLFNNSKSSLILQFDNNARHRRTHKLTQKEGKLDITKDADTLCRGMGQIRASCNGLLLTHNPRNRKQLLVCNPVTKLMCALPECLSGCPHEYYDDCSCSLAFDSSTNQYKVVHISDVESGFEMLNLGTTTATCSDDANKYSWRKVPWPSETLSQVPSEYIDFHDAILVDSKVLHWDISSRAYVMSMDVSEERPQETRLPCIHEIYITHDLGNIYFYMVEMGGCLSIMYFIHDEADNDYDDDDGTIDIWVLEDFEQGRSWIKKHSIGMKCVNFMRRRPRIDLLIPLGCLENGEVIVFDHQASTGLYVYDVRRNSMNKYFLKMRDCSSVLHKSSFTSWKQELVEVVD